VIKVAEENVLSPEEIDALFGKKEAETSEELSSEQVNLINSVCSKAIISTATILTTILKTEITFSNPKFFTLKKSEFLKKVSFSGVLADATYSGALNDNDYLILTKKDATIIADLMMGGDGSSPPGEINELYLGAIVEAITQIMASVANFISTAVGQEVKTFAPDIKVIDFSKEEANISVLDNPVFVLISYDFKIGNLVKSTLYQIPSLRLGAMLEAVKAKRFPAVSTKAASPTSFAAPSMGYGDSVHPVQFASIGGAGMASQVPGNISILLDVPMQVTVELGRTEMTIKDILALSEGSVVELNKLAGEPVDLLVNNKPIAKGGVVVIDENFGVRITEITTPSERLNRLG